MLARVSEIDLDRFPILVQFDTVVNTAACKPWTDCLTEGRPVAKWPNDFLRLVSVGGQFPPLKQQWLL